MAAADLDKYHKALERALLLLLLLLPCCHLCPAVQLKTTEMAAADLDKYHKALERALLAFHTGECLAARVSACWLVLGLGFSLRHVLYRIPQNCGCCHTSAYCLHAGCSHRAVGALLSRLSAAAFFCTGCLLFMSAYT
jgi:hypothetical protein